MPCTGVHPLRAAAERAGRCRLGVSGGWGEALAVACGRRIRAARGRAGRVLVPERQSLPARRRAAGEVPVTVRGGSARGPRAEGGRTVAPGPRVAVGSGAAEQRDAAETDGDRTARTRRPARGRRRLAFPPRHTGGAGGQCPAALVLVESQPAGSRVRTPAVLSVRTGQ